MENLKQICLSYFEQFEAKDMSALKVMFSENVSLRDWEIQAEGKEAVLAANQMIFAQADKIRVSPQHIYQEGHTVIAELEIVIDNTSKPLRVVDVIVFDESNRICAIRAYRG
jgi:ketosteroid isomerase-like protein